ncbi:MAG: dolichyl-phosphate beta-glucosyltransferase [Planctomycetota bacterium]
MPDLSAIIPTYNEEPNIRRSAGAVIEYLSRGERTWELLLVDDGSTDATRTIEQEIGASAPHVRVLAHSPNRGKGYAVREGMLAAQGEVRLFLDADYSTPIEEFEKLAPRLGEGADVVVGSRRLPDRAIETKPPLHRHLMGEAYVALTRWLLGVRLSDFNCGFKAFRAEAAERLFAVARRDDWSFDAEVLALAARLRYRIDEVTVRWAHVQRTSKVHPVRDALRSLRSLLAIRRDLRRGVYATGDAMRDA